ncbi:MAG: sugar kinase [Omnitrophica bacterium RIFCSPHIGHO2_02_FULL_51_18]|nr:MAG: sugar kinase [Omnitrophica bacterium RIFCSPHIGHO2_02_FULL_51_18]
MKKNPILAVGSVALDTVKTPFGRVNEALGGSATYFSASARFFSPVSVIAVVGSDFPGKHLEAMRLLGVDTSGIEVQKGKTFRWSGFYDFDLNTAHTLRTELNVFQHFRPKVSPEARSSRYVFLANIDPELQFTVLNQVHDPWLVACDTMNFWIENKRKALQKLLKKVDIFLCNDAEARELSGEYNLIRASKRILSFGPRLLLIKKGEHGVICFSKDFIFLAPAYLLEKVFDPTGAGDSFAGGFIGYLTRSPRLNESVVRQAAIYGSVLASYNVESFSLNRLVDLKRVEIERRYRHFRRLTRF